MPTLLLSRRDVGATLDLDACIAAVEAAFRVHAEGRTLGPASLGVAAASGGFHVKAAGLRDAPGRFAAKTNANFPGNPRRGLPTIQGIIALCDGEDGQLLAVMDSIEITILRTAAASAVAGRHLARPDSRLATLYGCGAQAAAQIRALARVLPLERVVVHDLDAARMGALADELSRTPGVAVETTLNPAAALRHSDVVITCTTSRLPFLRRDDVRPGAFVAAVGADSPTKSEIEPELMAAATVVVDNLGQCAEYGDLHHALEATVMTLADVHGELAEIVAGRKPGRRTPDEVFVFDSTGTALQDVALATLAYERARATGCGQPFEFAA